MPTYDYQCTKCSHAFELHQSMKDEPLAVCPKELCPRKTWGKGKVKRLLGTGAGLIFKGSGFYITDYRSESYKSGARKDSQPAPSAKAEAKTEAKGASKPASSPAPAKPKKP